MKHIPRLACLLSLVFSFGLLWAGCGKSVGDGAKVFASANPEIKTAWEKCQTAAKAKDYAAALSALQQLKTQPGLTPDQVKAIEQTATAVSDQMYEAANKGDAKAVEAINQLRHSQRR